MSIVCADAPDVLAARSPRDRDGDPYDHLEPELAVLHGLDPEDPSRARLREWIIDCCLPLADHLASRYLGRGQTFDDLRQVARLGTVLAVDRYDPGHESPFLAFAIPTITGELRRFFRDCGWTVHVPRRLKELHQRINAATPHLAQQLHRMPTRADLAADLDVPVGAIEEAMLGSHCYHTESLDMLIDVDDDPPLPRSGMLAVTEPLYEVVEDALAVAPHLRSLSQEDLTLLALRFSARLSQQQIGDHLGVSQMTVCRMLLRILQDLRARASADAEPAECAAGNPGDRARGGGPAVHPARASGYPAQVDR
ncbi:sigma-70 family RNA polymerase sigma factor [Nocardia sp. alder85J]|uniref:sigma-70 family RNA polymerase sigma factor n=1 Tax=Nocardia sp. alder85J TaxID=2862949 RepID=UPI001CD77D00|nr:sigma-70 family RNA polymerase sigma factor [Nocardia sp. alder85J]MCX4092984.1 sigma-70 family RNA polymerase sigma factor [Nocardia sp. alder85J]